MASCRPHHERRQGAVSNVSVVKRAVVRFNASGVRGSANQRSAGVLPPKMARGTDKQRCLNGDTKPVVAERR